MYAGDKIAESSNCVLGAYSIGLTHGIGNRTLDSEQGVGKATERSDDVSSDLATDGKPQDRDGGAGGLEISAPMLLATAKV